MSGELSRVYLSVHTPRYCTYEAAFAGRYSRERHPVSAHRTHRSLVYRSDHDTLPKASYPVSAGCLQDRRLRAGFSKDGSIVGTAAARRS